MLLSAAKKISVKKFSRLRLRLVLLPQMDWMNLTMNSMKGHEEAVAKFRSSHISSAG
jgi:hypothetical protein